MYAEDAMPSIFRTTSIWTGATGLPGYTNLYFNNEGTDVSAAVTTIAGALEQFWTDVNDVLPSAVSITVQPEVAQLDVATGDLETLWAINPSPDPITGAQSGVGPSPVGACISWGTGEVYRGRTVRGRTFLVPLGRDAFQSDGSLETATLTAINGAAVGLLGVVGPYFGIWARPDATSASPDGAFFGAATGVCRDKAAVLRSRRD